MPSSATGLLMWVLFNLNECSKSAMIELHQLEFGDKWTSLFQFSTASQQFVSTIQCCAAKLQTLILHVSLNK